MMYITFILRELFLFVISVIGFIIFPFITYPLRHWIWRYPNFFKWFFGLYYFTDRSEVDFIQNWYGLYELVPGSYQEFYQMNWFQKYLLSWNWLCLRNPHWELTLLFKPNKGDYEDVKVYSHEGEANVKTWRNKTIFGKQSITYSIDGCRYFRYSFTRNLKPKSLIRKLGYEYINFMVGAAENRYLIKLRFFKIKDMITTKQLFEKYGEPNQEGSYLVMIDLPYPMRLAWDTKVVVNKMRCHKLVADNFSLVFKDLLCYYGLAEIQRLGIDLFGGCFNFRKMRGGSDYSRHSWGVAIDLDPARNKLRESKKTARFARSEYKPMIDIFYANGFESLGVEKNYDWMHFQIKE